MNICLIGNTLSSLTLAKILVNTKLNVSLYQEIQNSFSTKTRTLGISKYNLQFLNKKVIKLDKKYIWDINQIDIFTENSLKEKIFNFEKNNQPLFSIIKNDYIRNKLEKSLNKNKYFKKILIKKNFSYKKILDKNYDLVINCDSKNILFKKFSNDKITKDYNSFAFTTVINHQKIKNNKATQIFTKFGPLAFLPMSNKKTSIVFSIMNQKPDIDENNILEIINQYNKIYKIRSVEKFQKFRLNFFNIRKYFNRDFMAFGESLYKIHPLAGQGFNMTIRDIKILSEIIEKKISLGLQLDQSVYQEFENKTKHFNFIFSNGIDFIYEFFKINNKHKNKYPNLFLKQLGKNKTFLNITSKYADKGIFV